MYTTSEIRNKFIEYFNSKQHTSVDSSSLVPINDPTLLFVNAGMVQFKDIFLGAEKRKYTRAVTSQKCVRAGGKHNDLDQVGYTARHHTFFEMLGNFSFGDYFKKDAIKFAWEFLTKELDVPVEKLLVTVFEEDDEAEKIWLEVIGLPADKVLRIGAKDNFWQMGDTGPCGPCTEIFYDHGEHIPGDKPGTPDEDGDRFIEIWNLVFMQYDKQEDGQLIDLPKPCVDTGMGLERIASILQGKHNNYDIDLFQHIINYIIPLLDVNDKSDPSLKVIADHIRTCSFLICDGILPSNEGRGYVLRRIIRRAIRHGYKLGATEVFFHKIFIPLCEVMSAAYPELLKNKELIQATLKKEEIRFSETLDTGMAILNKAINQLTEKVIPGKVAFKLYDTYGFPFDLTQDIAREQNLSIDIDGFNDCMSQQIQRSKSSGSFSTNNNLSAEVIASIKPTEFIGYEYLSNKAQVVALLRDNKPVKQLSNGDNGAIIFDKTPFYAESGGQVGDIGKLHSETAGANVYDTQKVAGNFHLHLVKDVNGTICIGDKLDTLVQSETRNNIVLNHTATHLLHKVLQDQLGSHVQQKGSIVSNEKLRFDFSHSDAIDTKQLQQIESEVNLHIRANYQAETKIMSFDKAIETGAMALFGEKYGDDVRVLDLGGYSIELCGGTHVNSTGEIGLFKIFSESSIAAGIRRIEAVTGESAINYVQNNQSKLDQIIYQSHSSLDTVNNKVKDIITKNKKLEKQLQTLEQKIAGNKAEDLWSNIQVHNGINFLFEVLQNIKIDNMRSIVDKFRDKFETGILVLANHTEKDKVQLISSVSKNLIKEVKAGDIVRKIAGEISGKGGGRPDFAQGGGESSLDNLNKVLNNYQNELKNLIKKS
ncbi:MAG: alanine--tRNA ligase [Marinicellaceae bacterium]